MARSQERHRAEEGVIASCLEELIEQWHRKGDYERLKCIELLLAKDLPNKEASDLLNLSEQAVANHKYFVINKLKDAAQRAKVQNFDLSEFGLS